MLQHRRLLLLWSLSNSLREIAYRWVAVALMHAVYRWHLQSWTTVDSSVRLVGCISKTWVAQGLLNDEAPPLNSAQVRRWALARPAAAAASCGGSVAGSTLLDSVAELLSGSGAANGGGSSASGHPAGSGAIDGAAASPHHHAMPTASLTTPAPAPHAHHEGAAAHSAPPPPASSDATSFAATAPAGTAAALAADDGPAVDVVFLHGIRGGPFITWRRSGDPSVVGGAMQVRRGAVQRQLLLKRRVSVASAGWQAIMLLRSRPCFPAL